MKENKPVHILLADDDEDDTSLFQEALEQIQISTRLDIAENGMELMHTLADNQHVPDLIFLDMNMPIKNGLECLVEIRNSDDFKEIPVVILSTSVADYLLKSAYQAGANLYIQKPTSFSGLVQIIEKCLSRKEDLKNTTDLEQFLIRNNNN
ncbi:response regulator [Dyadobacter psychrotolerans]|uniref:Response regulator n=1 Tax=Dyadobacter psychrotolerans TaxID=2541721 RepID=A0A4R5DFY5_9BACT|nr:response regulator [Dyadobacter psychrotolerans]TDE12856.1 response regulator [Dyadobacter psychrotolerans]